MKFEFNMTDPAANFEEGEIKVIDEQNYIMSDSYFKFRFEN